MIILCAHESGLSQKILKLVFSYSMFHIHFKSTVIKMSVLKNRIKLNRLSERNLIKATINK